DYYCQSAANSGNHYIF
nr:immunoglobulin light chain junction region [Macaca mulatta]MOX70803.1 immunoglobulin light chain junction region [Macaca mulatta]MOX76706.1 immunoglobulin light chain junction region [Macaca mulatta]